MALEQAVERVVERVQVLDEQVAAVAVTWRFTDEGADFADGIALGLAALERVAGRGSHDADGLNRMGGHGRKPSGSGAGC